MTGTPISQHGYDEGERFFHEKDKETLRKLRAKLDAEKSAAASGQKPSHWMKCPKCGGQLTEVEVEVVKIDRCGGCGGVFLDKGELELLTRGRGSASGFFGKFFRV